ncbi:MAG: hypothetical protein HRT87_03430 [Legionellales bacterium]|nr:hypothetical protein [Legionellales bacterium]
MEKTKNGYWDHKAPFDQSINEAAAKKGLEGKSYKIKLIDVSEVRAHDTIVFDGKLMTVGPKNIKYDSFMGHSVFGSSFILGTQKVVKVLFKRYQ